MKTLLKRNAGEVGQESAAPEVDSFLLATDSPDSIKRGTELYEICFEKETLEFRDVAIGDCAQSHETNSALVEAFTPDLFNKRRHSEGPYQRTSEIIDWALAHGADD